MQPKKEEDKIERTIAIHNNVKGRINIPYIKTGTFSLKLIWMEKSL